jgi:MFS transporter, DHA1 family, tetracycline resistance protein
MPSMSETSIQTELPHSHTSPKKAMFIVFLVVFIDLLGFGIVLPLLPLYGERFVEPLFEGGEKSRAGGAIVGLLMASFSAMQFLFAPLWGRVSDRVGRRPILLIGLVGSVLFYALFGYASDLPKDKSAAALALTLLFIARIGAGISGATISTAQAVIADCTTPERRKHGMALIGAAFGIGFTFGPLIGAGALKLLPNHLGVTGYIASGLSFIALLVAIAILPETRRFGEASAARRKWFDTQAIRAALANHAVAPVVWTFFLATLGFASFEVTLSLLNRDALRLPNDSNFLVFAYVGFVLMLAQGVLYRRLANKVSEPTFMAAGITLMGLGVLSLGSVTWTADQLGVESVPAWLFLWTFASLTLAVVGFALLTPSAQALVSRRSDPERQGEVLGVNQSAASMARILGPIFGLTLYGLTSGHLLPYLFGGALLLAMLPLIPMIRRGGMEATPALASQAIKE